MALTDTDLRTYQDDALVIVVPAYLRRIKNMLYFNAPKIDKPGRRLITMSAGVANDATQAIRLRRNLLRAKEHVLGNVEFRIIRAGATAWMEDGTELMATRYNVKTGIRQYDITVLYPLGRYFVNTRIIGKGEFSEFDELCQSLIHRIRLADEAGQPNGTG